MNRIRTSGAEYASEFYLRKFHPGECSPESFRGFGAAVGLSFCAFLRLFHLTWGNRPAQFPALELPNERPMFGIGVAGLALGPRTGFEVLCPGRQDLPDRQ